MTSTDRLRSAASVLAVVSVLGVVGTGVTAAVVQARAGSGGGSGTLERDKTDGSTGFDYTGWERATGPSVGSGPASYRVPGGADWEIGTAEDPIGFEDGEGGTLVNGTAASFYYGNACSDDGSRVPAAWALLADAESGTDVEGVAVRVARGWARGYATGPDGTMAPLTEPEAEDIELLDGTPAVAVRIGLDMTVFEGPCVRTEAELITVSWADEGKVKSLVAARYVDVPGTISDEEYDAILGSLEP